MMRKCCPSLPTCSSQPKWSSRLEALQYTSGTRAQAHTKNTGRAITPIHHVLRNHAKSLVFSLIDSFSLPELWGPMGPIWVHFLGSLLGYSWAIFRFIMSLKNRTKSVDCSSYRFNDFGMNEQDPICPLGGTWDHFMNRS